MNHACWIVLASAAFRLCALEPVPLKEQVLIKAIVLDAPPDVSVTIPLIETQKYKTTKNITELSAPQILTVSGTQAEADVSTAVEGNDLNTGKPKVIKVGLIL